MRDNSMETARRMAAELGLDIPPDDRKETESRRLAADAGMNIGEDVSAPRDISVITDEILFYKVQAGRSFLEIGRRLNEAKAQLSHGEWLPWLKEKVDISERRAQDFMRLAREFSKSAEIADLGASKALQLLTLPDSERSEFVTEKHTVDGQEKTVDEMTGQELAKAIKERDAALAAKAEAEKSLDDMVDEISDAQRERDEALKAKQEAEDSLQTRLDEQKKLIAGDLEAERAKVQALMTKSDDLQAKLRTEREKAKDAKAASETAKRELEDLKKKPIEVAVAEPSKETLDKLREEAAAAAEEKVKEANARLIETQEKVAAAEAEAEKIRKQLELADQSSVAFKFYFEEWQHKFNAMLGALQEVEQSDQLKAEKLRKAIHAAAEKMGAMA